MKNDKYFNFIKYVNNDKAYKNYYLCQSRDVEGKKLAYLLQLNKLLDSDKTIIVYRRDKSKCKAIIPYDRLMELLETERKYKEKEND